MIGGGENMPYSGFTDTEIRISDEIGQPPSKVADGLLTDNRHHDRHRCSSPNIPKIAHSTHAIDSI